MARSDDNRTILLIASHQATIAAEAMLRAGLDGLPVEGETVDKLADAVKLLVEAEFNMKARGNEDLARLHAEVVAFINGDHLE